MCNLVAVTANHGIRAEEAVNSCENLTKEELDIIVDGTGLDVSRGKEICMLQGLIADVVAYLLSYEHDKDSETIAYGQPFEINHCQLLCLLFLIDWRTALLDTGHHDTLTGGTWCRGLQGPYVNGILEMVKESRPMTEIFRYDLAEPVKLYFLARRDGGLERDDAEVLEPLTDYQKEVIRHAVDSFRDVEMGRLIELVYATDPMIDVELHEPIDIVGFAAHHVRLYGQLNV